MACATSSALREALPRREFTLFGTTFLPTDTLLFMLLFVTTGIGNGSTFRMIPVIFRTLHERLSAGKGAAEKEQAIKAAGKESAAVLGFSSAIGAFGAFFIPKSFGSSIALTGGPEVALYVFVGYYVSCILVTWWWYSRKGAETPC